MLIVVSGLPGTGKTTIARRLAIELAAVYLRIDSIEQSIRGAGRDYRPWDVERMVIDTARSSAEQGVRTILAEVSGSR